MKKDTRLTFRRRPIQKFRDDLVAKDALVCSRCGFIAEHTCQIDIDHIDGNRLNNDPSNFVPLCANCHRLKTVLSREHVNEYSKGRY